jgi:beta-glucanase (GH16 family)
MVALWMIGYEDQPERSAIVDEFSKESIAIDIRQYHTYAADWTPTYIAFYVDDRLIKLVRQSIAYPMQFMLGIYEFADGPAPASPVERYPKEFVVDWFRAWRRATG